MVKRAQLEEMILQSLEHERGGVQVYEAAVNCAIQKGLKNEWEEYLGQTRDHVQILQNVCQELRIDAEAESPEKDIVRHLDSALVDAMQLAKKSSKPDAAQLVACECVVLTETKNHADWELLGKCAEKLTGYETKVLPDACEKVEEEEDEHFYHTKGWCRELWLDSVGLEAVLPPPGEKNVKTAIGAAGAKQASERVEACRYVLLEKRRSTREATRRKPC